MEVEAANPPLWSFATLANLPSGEIILPVLSNMSLTTFSLIWFRSTVFGPGGFGCRSSALRAITAAALSAAISTRVMAAKTVILLRMSTLTFRSHQFGTDSADALGKLSLFIVFVARRYRGRRFRHQWSGVYVDSARRHTLHMIKDSDLL